MMTGEPAGVVLLKAPQSVWAVVVCCEFGAAGRGARIGEVPWNRSQLSGADCGVTADAVSRAFLSVVAGSWETLTTHRARWYRDVRG
jgi:hypothetical protein